MNEVNFARPGGQSISIESPEHDGPDTAAVERISIPLVEQYLRIAFRWKWLIAGAVAIAVLIGILYTLLATPLYTATTRLEISREGNRIVSVGSVEPETTAVDMEFYQTQYGLLESRALAERVARELKLIDNDEFFVLFGRDDLVDSASGGAAAATRDERAQAAAKILLENVQVSPIRLSRLVDLSWVSPDPQLSAQVTNAWAEAFIQSNLERRFEATAYARRFLEERLEQLRGRLEESERQLVGFASNQAIINVPAGNDAQGNQAERSLTADSLVTLNAALAEAIADRVAAESRLNQASGPTAESVSNTAIAAMRERRAQTAAEYERLMTQFEPGYPPALALAAQIRELDQNITREEARVQTSIRSAYRDAVQRERSLTARVEGLKGDFLDQRRRSIQYNIYQRDVDTNRELYDGLLQRYKEIGVTGGVGNNNVAVVDPARVPERPSHPRPLINMVVALLAGLVAGIGLALVREQLDETISDPADLERRIDLPLLGAIPTTVGHEQPRDQLRDPKSVLTEAYLSVQSSLAFSSDHGIPQTLAVTSTRASEGKSTTSYAIAYSIARSGARTILVDGDMRSPSVHDDLGISNERGFSNYLSGTDDLESLIQYPEGHSMAVLTAGPQPPNAAELLRGARFTMLLAELRKKFDHIVVDSPPVLGLADAPTITSRVEATIFVIEAKAVKARMARRAIERLRQSRARLVGTVLTKFDARQAHFGYGYDYGYGYGYGDARHEKPKKPA